MKKKRFTSARWIPVFSVGYFVLIFGYYICGFAASKIEVLTANRMFYRISSLLIQPAASLPLPKHPGSAAIWLFFAINAITWGFIAWLLIKLFYSKYRVLKRIVAAALLLWPLLYAGHSTFVYAQRFVTSSIQESLDAENEFLKVFLEFEFQEAISNGIPLVISDTLSLNGIIRDNNIRDVKKKLMRFVEYRQKSTKMKEAIHDLFRKNSTNCVFSSVGALSLNHVLISSAEREEIFNSPSPEAPDDSWGWRLFYKRYPDSPGIIHLSRVGFSRDGSVAVIYKGNQSDWAAGKGVLCCFEKIDDKWERCWSSIQWVS